MLPVRLNWVWWLKLPVLFWIIAWVRRLECNVPTGGEVRVLLLRPLFWWLYCCLGWFSLKLNCKFVLLDLEAEGDTNECRVFTGDTGQLLLLVDALSCRAKLLLLKGLYDWVIFLCSFVARWLDYGVLLVPKAMPSKVLCDLNWLSSSNYRFDSFFPSLFILFISIFNLKFLLIHSFYSTIRCLIFYFKESSIIFYSFYLALRLLSSFMISCYFTLCYFFSNS